MKVLVVGNMGYVGPVLTKHLRLAYPQASLIGFDYRPLRALPDWFHASSRDLPGSPGLRRRSSYR